MVAAFPPSRDEPAATAGRGRRECGVVPGDTILGKALVSRERVLRAIRRGEIDRVPMRYNGRPEVDEALARYLGIPMADNWHEHMMRELGIDVRNVSPPAPKRSPGPVNDGLPPARGLREPAEVLAALEASPGESSSPENVDSEPLIEQVRHFDSAGDPPWLTLRVSGPWSYADELIGLERTLIALAEADEAMSRVFDHLTDRICALVGSTAGVLGDRLDMVYLADDLGTQRGPLISPAMVARTLMPLYRRIVERVHAAGAVFCMHCCGAIHDLIPQFIDAGVDVVNPLQPCAADMQPEVLARDFGGCVAFCGGIDMQHLLPFGTPQQVADEVRRYIRALGLHGGYVLDSANILHTDVPPANIEAMFRAGRECRLN